MNEEQRSDLRRVADALIVFNTCYTASSEFVIRDKNPWATMIIIARILAEEQRGRYLSPIKLIGDVTPDLISQSTGLRLIARMEESGLVTTQGDGRAQQVIPTQKLFEEMRAYLRCFGAGFGPVLGDLQQIVERTAG